MKRKGAIWYKVIVYSYARLIHCMAEDAEDATDWMIVLRQRLQRKCEQLERG